MTWIRTTVAVVAAGCLAACGAAETGAPATGSTATTESSADAAPTIVAEGPIVLISVDTLRADRLPVYGYDLIEAPAVERLARDGVTWTTAFAHAPTTFASHASIFTGQTPSQHGVRDNVGYELADSAVTLAERAGAAGYRTAGFVSSYPMRGGTGLDQGFAVWDDDLDAAGEEAGIGEIQRAGATTVARASEWLQSQPDADFFLFLHLFEPHLPYAAPDDWAQRYESPYDAEVAYADHLIGRFLDALDAAGHYDSATIVFLSDHGEGLGDHNEDDHGVFVYPSTLQVPLIIKLPRAARAGERVDLAAQLGDVAPTLLRHLGEPAPEVTVGRDLLAASVESTAIYAETYQPALHFGWSELLTLIDYPYQYIHAPTPELYDLATDRLATNNLISERSEVAAGLRDRLEGMEVAAAAPREVDAATRDRLAALGYVTAGRSAGDGALPDPKDRIHLLQQLKTASAAFFAAEYEVAIVQFKAALDEDPTMPTAWEWLGRSQRAAGRPVEALESFEMVTSLGSGDATVDRTMAALALQVGQLDVAAAAANRLMTVDPLPARSVLARVALGQGRPDDAIALADRILADAPASSEANLIRGEALALKGDLQGALDAARAAASDPQAESTALVLGGRVLMIAGQVLAARDNFRLALETDPSMLSAYAYLAASHIVQREMESALAALTAMVQRNPGVAAEQRAIETLESFGLTAQAEQWRAAARQRNPAAAGQIR